MVDEQGGARPQRCARNGQALRLGVQVRCALKRSCALSLHFCNVHIVVTPTSLHQQFIKQCHNNLVQTALAMNMALHQFVRLLSRRRRNGGFQCLNGGCALSASSLISIPKPGRVGSGKPKLACSSAVSARGSNRGKISGFQSSSPGSLILSSSQPKFGTYSGQYGCHKWTPTQG